METFEHNTAGCYLLKHLPDKRWQIMLIYKEWPTGQKGWVPPKGHVESGETLEAAAVRETAEETGYTDMKILTALTTADITYDWVDGTRHHKLIHWFLAVLNSENQQALQLSQVEQKDTKKQQWFSLEEARAQLLFADEKQILEEVIKYLAANPDV